MPEKILITSDSTTDLGPELIKRYRIPIMPLGVSLNEHDYTDGVDITPEMIYDNYRRKKTLPKTSSCISFLF